MLRDVCLEIGTRHGLRHDHADSLTPRALFFRSPSTLSCLTFISLAATASHCWTKFARGTLRDRHHHDRLRHRRLCRGGAAHRCRRLSRQALHRSKTSPPRSSVPQSAASSISSPRTTRASAYRPRRGPSHRPLSGHGEALPHPLQGRLHHASSPHRRRIRDGQERRRADHPPERSSCLGALQHHRVQHVLTPDAV